ncbi:hypothetical protein BDZ97DRAFT_65997 [Flammula alnicola]|nr:hypothetical protein BDZ97DRAFT_65997 [Flammula alnicola]
MRLSRPSTNCIRQNTGTVHRARVLHTLDLQSRHHVIWSDINEDTRKLLQNLCQSSISKQFLSTDLSTSSLTSSMVQRLNTSFFIVCRLKTLCRWLHCDYPLNWRHSTSITLSPSSKHALGVSACWALPFSHLKKLVTTIYEPRDLDTACALAQRSSPVLQTLHLSFIFNVRIPSPPFDITQFPDLRHLKLGFTSEPTRQGHGTAPLKLLCHFLSASTPLSSLETITIEITVTQEIQQRIYSFDKDHWRALDKAISKPLLACVRQVNIIARFRIVGLYHGSAFVESAFVQEVRELIEPLFPRLSMNEAIDFKIDIVPDFVGRGFLPIF